MPSPKGLDMSGKSDKEEPKRSSYYNSWDDDFDVDYGLKSSEADKTEEGKTYTGTGYTGYGGYSGSYNSGYGSGYSYGGTYGGTYKKNSWTGGYSNVWAGRWGWGGSTFADENDKLKDGLQTVARTVYVALGADRDKQTLYVAFPDPEDKALMERKDIIFLDRDVLLKTDKREEFSEDAARQDVLCGDALLGSAAKTTVDPDVWEKSKKEQKLTQGLYISSEVENASRQTLDHAPGFEPYLESRVKYRTKENYIEKLSTEAQKPKPRKDWMCGLLQHELTDRQLNPIDYGAHEEFIKKSADELRACKTSEERLATAKRILKEMEKITEPPPPSGGEGADGGSGESDKTLMQPGPKEGEGDGKSKGKNKGKGEEEGEGEGEGEDNEPTPEGKTILAPITHDSEATHSKELDVPDGGRSDVDVHVQFIDVIDKRNSSRGEDATNTYNSIVRKVRPQITALRNKVQFRNDDVHIYEHGQRSGSLDEGGLEKLAFKEDMPAVFEKKETISKPNAVIGILVDESGSMGTSSYEGEKSEQARKVAVTLYEALKDVEGVTVCVFGHTSTYGQDKEGHSKEDCVLFVYASPAQKRGNYVSMAHITGRSNNYDSFAMEKASDLLFEWFPDVNDKYLFVISDGQPAGQNYGGRPAQKHMLKVCETARRKKSVDILGIGVANAYSKEWGDKAYGEGKSVVLSDVESAGTVIGAFVTRKFMRKS